MSRFSRARVASPQLIDDDDIHDNNNDNNHLYTTATETSFKDLLHSTPQRGSNGLPLHYDQHPSPRRTHQRQDLDPDTLGSAEMSIELGRGVKRAQQDFADMSSNAIFSFEHTPPLQPRSAHRNGDAGLRKQASLRRATESARANDASKRTSTNRTVSDTPPRRNVENEPVQTTGTFSLRGSRFAGVQQVSSQYNVPKRYSVENGLEDGSSHARRAAPANVTVQSATFTAGQSFLLPDLPNITELVSGRNEGTPLVRRTTTSRTRFVSGTHRAVNALAVPQDEQAIFASLQVLGDRVAQLELEKSEAQKHVEEYEHEVIELRAQLGRQRPDSGLGSEDDDSVQLARPNHARLHAKIKAAEERLQRTERKASVSEITVARIVKERDHLVQQLASSYVENEELEKENQSFRESIDDMLAENEGLKARVRQLEETESHLRCELEHSAQPQETSKSRKASRRRSESNARRDDIAEGLTIDQTANVRKEPRGAAGPRSRRRSSQLNDTAKQDLSSRVQREIEKQREAGLATAEELRNAGAGAGLRSRSRSQRRTQVSASDVFTGSGDAAATRERRNVEAFASLTHRSASYAQKFEEDLTQLTDLEPVDVANLRRKLEAEMRARHASNQNGAQSEADHTSRSATQRSVTRKSSMRDLTTGNADGIDSTKTVRVQSPHTADEISHSGHDTVGDVSSLSNTSRRRRRSVASEGLTSAFILPDITVAMDQVSMPIPITDRPTYNPDSTDITLRPSQTPALALATVIRHLEDEIAQLKCTCDAENKAYTGHDPAMAKRSRLACLARIDVLRKQIEKRSDQVYALYDVLEAHKADVPQDGETGAAAEQQDDAEDSDLAFEGFSEIGDSEDESREVRI